MWLFLLLLDLYTWTIWSATGGVILYKICHLVTILAVEVLGGLQDGQVELWNGGWRDLGMSLGKVVDEHTWGKDCMELVCEDQQDWRCLK